MGAGGGVHVESQPPRDESRVVTKENMIEDNEVLVQDMSAFGGEGVVQGGVGWHLTERST